MNFTNIRAGGLTAAQSRFLNDCFASRDPLRKVMKRRRVSPTRLELWLKREAFVEHLHRLLQLFAREREMDVTIGATKGAAILHDAVATKPRAKKPKPPPALAQLRAAEMMIKLARQHESRSESAASEASPQQSRGLAHPDLSDDQADELRKSLGKA
jgi:hypothetical protein